MAGFYRCDFVPGWGLFLAVLVYALECFPEVDETYLGFYVKYLGFSRQA